MTLKLKPSPEAIQHDLPARSNKDKLGLISLEPRILLDAAGFVTGADVAMEAMVAENVDFGVEAIFADDASASFETSEVDVQNSELLNALAIAPLGESEEPSAAPREFPWLINGSDKINAASLGEGEDTSAAPREFPWLINGSGEINTATLGEGEEPSAAPREFPWL